MNKSSALVSSNWDRAYRDGKYDSEGPVPFVKDIVEHLENEQLHGGVGFYPGCGNGRNLIPLLEAGLDIEANDISSTAVEQLKEKRDVVKVQVGDFLSSTVSRPYDYLLSIQLFQHVNEHGVERLFEKVDQLLRRGGVFALRVNSIHTQIAEKHSKLSTSAEGGFTIRYESGQKNGQHIHFYSAEEIHRLTADTFDVIMPLREEFIPRDNGTYWTQWETILKKR